MPSLPPVKLAIPEPQDFIATEECASAFMSRSQHSKTLRHVPIPGFVLPDIKGAPEFRLPSNPADCCDLCKELQRLVVKAIGPDLRSESAQAIFYPCRYHLALDITVPDEEDPESSGYVIAKSFYVYSHPGTYPSSWYEHTLMRFKTSYALGISSSRIPSRGWNGHSPNCKSAQRSMTAITLEKILPSFLLE